MAKSLVIGKLINVKHLILLWENFKCKFSLRSHQKASIDSGVPIIVIMLLFIESLNACHVCARSLFLLCVCLWPQFEWEIFLRQKEMTKSSGEKWFQGECNFGLRQHCFNSRKLSMKFIIAQKKFNNVWLVQTHRDLKQFSGPYFVLRCVTSHCV